MKKIGMPPNPLVPYSAVGKNVNQVEESFKLFAYNPTITSISQYSPLSKRNF